MSRLVERITTLTKAWLDADDARLGIVAQRQTLTRAASKCWKHGAVCCSFLGFSCIMFAHPFLKAVYFRDI